MLIGVCHNRRVVRIDSVPRAAIVPMTGAGVGYKGEKFRGKNNTKKSHASPVDRRTNTVKTLCIREVKTVLPSLSSTKIRNDLFTKMFNISCCLQCLAASSCYFDSPALPLLPCCKPSLMLCLLCHPLSQPVLAVNLS